MTRSGSENIVWFTDADATNPALVGGKGANLGNMTGKGFQVPPGFTISTSILAFGIRSKPFWRQ
jgi:phosphoenolpyruvate synthase/pyruvate phosphate dikinase